jgi:polysaccharide pyruvyl transferase WcaK-like protein
MWHGGYTYNNQFSLTVDYQILINKIIEYFHSLTNIKLHIIPHVILKDSSGVENDYAISEMIVEKYNNIILAPKFKDPISAKNYISGLDFFIGARMHSTIAAFSSGVPIYAMAYSRKFTGLFIDTLDYSYVGDMAKDTSDDIFNKMTIAFKNRKDLKNIIEYKQKYLLQQKEKFCRRIIEFLDIDKDEENKKDN